MTGEANVVLMEGSPNQDVNINTLATFPVWLARQEQLR